MHRVLGILDVDLIVMHVVNSGLKVFTWNYDTDSHTLSKVDMPEYKGEIDYIKATPDGQFIIVGLPNVGLIKFFRVDRAKGTLTPLRNGTIEVSKIIMVS